MNQPTRRSGAGWVGLPEPANRIARSAVWYWIVRNLIAVVVLSAVVVALEILIPMSGGVHAATVAAAALALVVGLAVGIGVPVWRYAVHRWEATEHLVLTRSGAIFRDWRIVPLDRVQTVEVSQGVWERAFGVSRLVIKTASYAGSTDIAGLDIDIARDVASQLTRALTHPGDDGA